MWPPNWYWCVLQVVGLWGVHGLVWFGCAVRRAPCSVTMHPDEFNSAQGRLISPAREAWVRGPRWTSGCEGDPKEMGLR